MNEGWIKIHRKVLDSGFWMESEAVHLWIHLLIKAAHNQRKTYWNGNLVELQEGQLITGRKKLSEETGIGEQVIRKWLKIFEVNQQITIEKTSVGSCISILNYNEYQEKNQHSNQRATSGQPTTNQRSTNDQPLYKELKNDKNDKNVRRGSIAAFAPPSPDQVRDYFFEIGINGQEFEKFHDYYTGNGWKVGRNQMKDWKAACRNWKRKMTEFKEKNNGKQSVAKDRIESIREWGERMGAGGNSGQ